MKILVTGAKGVLGREVVKAAHQKWSIGWTNAYGHEHLDITDAASVYGALRDDHPDVVINCAGLTKHRDASDVDMRRVNSLGPLLLARSCEAIGARLIHVSTDCVFSGTRPLAAGPYIEADVPDATDVYGESKAFGEVVGAPHLTVRTSFIGWGGGLLEWLAGPHDIPIPLWHRAYWSGSTAPAIARALVELAQKPEVTGLMHLASEGYTTKAQLTDSLWSEQVVARAPAVWVSEPYVNRWLASTRDDVPVLPPLVEALRELRR